MDEKLTPQRLNGSKGLRAVEAIKILASGLDATEHQLVLKLLETVSAELKLIGPKAA